MHVIGGLPVIGRAECQAPESFTSSEPALVCHKASSLRRRHKQELCLVALSAAAAQLQTLIYKGHKTALFCFVFLPGYKDCKARSRKELNIQ